MINTNHETIKNKYSRYIKVIHRLNYLRLLEPSKDLYTSFKASRCSQRYVV